MAHDTLWSVDGWLPAVSLPVVGWEHVVHDGVDGLYAL